MRKKISLYKFAESIEALMKEYGECELDFIGARYVGDEQYHTINLIVKEEASANIIHKTKAFEINMFDD